ncbi:MAG: YncE family protein, partial [Verrucomicrobiota bacterium]
TAYARDGMSLRRLAELRFTHPTNEVSDVALSPDGRLALAAVREGGHLQVLRFDGQQWGVEPRRISVYGRPYRVLFTPDGRLALTAGAGAGNAPDTDALTVIAVKGNTFRTTDFVALGSGPESIELSPDGRHALGVMMNGSNLPADSPHRTGQGQLVLLERTGDTFVRRQVLPVGRIPEGACFTPDGRHVVVQCHPERRLWILALHRGRLKDTGRRVDVPGFPSGLGAGGGR